MVQRNTKRTIEERFWAFVVKGGGCWEWTGAANDGGYGQFTVNGRQVAAHRFSWKLHFGEIPEGRFVCHHCDNPGCPRPDHLFLGDAADNAEDCKRKGRRARGSQSWSATHKERLARGDRHGFKVHPESVRRGERHAQSKLRASDVHRIRELLAAGAGHRRIAQLFRVDRSTITAIHTGKNWKVDR